MHVEHSYLAAATIEHRACEKPVTSAPSCSLSLHPKLSLYLQIQPISVLRWKSPSSWLACNPSQGASQALERNMMRDAESTAGGKGQKWGKSTATHYCLCSKQKKGHYPMIPQYLYTCPAYQYRTIKTFIQVLNSSPILLWKIFSHTSSNVYTCIIKCYEEMWTTLLI